MPAARSLGAGAVYALAIFALGFVLGVVRVLVLAPLTGETAAVAVELPVILIVSWFAAAGVARWFAVPRAVAPRFLMGAAALAVILAADILLGLLLLGMGPQDLAARYRTAPGLAGLAGQVVFAALPLVQIMTGGRARG